MTGWHGNPVDDDDNDDTVFRVRDMLPAGILTLLGLIGLVLASLSAGPSTGQYLVIAAPWRREQVADLVWRAGGVAGFGNLSPVYRPVAMSDQPGFAGMLRKQGAWIVLPAPRALGCFHPKGTEDGDEGRAGQAADGIQRPLVWLLWAHVPVMGLAALWNRRCRSARPCWQPPFWR